MAIKISQLSEAIKKEFELYEKATLADISAAAEQVAEESVQRLAQTSPRNAGRFAKAWRHKADGGKSYRVDVVYNLMGHLTHLLEYGHALVRGGRTVGYVKARPFIAAEEKRAQADFETNLRRRIEK